MNKFIFSTVLRNIISNAIKFSSKNGEITVNTKIDNDKVIISIKDTGIGMSEELVNNLFKIQYNTKRVGTYQEKGSGLGLYICNEYLKNICGKIMWKV
jgi:two-component system sensor histidine kinase/response regulator